MERCLIPWKIGDDEILIRCIVAPTSYNPKKEQLKLAAYLPGNNKQDVSLLRLKLCSLNFCKSFAKRLAEGQTDRRYVGLAAFRVAEAKALIDSIANSPKYKGQGKYAELRASPMKNEQDYYPNGDMIYSDSPGNPFHADLYYHEPRIITKGDLAPPFLEDVADAFIDHFVFKRDSDPISDTWNDGPLID